MANHYSLLADNPLKCSCSLLFLFNSLAKRTNAGDDDDNDDDDDDYDDGNDYDYDDDDSGHDYKEAFCLEGTNSAKRHNISHFPGSRDCGE